MGCVVDVDLGLPFVPPFVVQFCAFLDGFARRGGIACDDLQRGRAMAAGVRAACRGGTDRSKGKRYGIATRELSWTVPPGGLVR